MLTKCPDCDSTDIVSDLMVYSIAARRAGNEILVVHVDLSNPNQKSEPLLVGFRAAICCGCGHTKFYTNRFKELKEAVRKGYVNREK